VDALRIPYGGVLTLFECFLASVATCVHTSPSSPAGVLGAEAAREIRQIAVYAADHMMDRHRRQRQEHTMAAEGGENVDPSAGEGHGAASFTFGTFGEWYNSGGFELVPWLELLDRSKWETTGDASGHATTEDTAKGAHPRDDKKATSTSPAQAPAPTRQSSKTSKGSATRHRRRNSATSNNPPLLLSLLRQQEQQASDRLRAL